MYIVSIYIYICIYMYTHSYIYVCVHTYMCVYSIGKWPPVVAIIVSGTLAGVFVCTNVNVHILCACVRI